MSLLSRKIKIIERRDALRELNRELDDDERRLHLVLTDELEEVNRFLARQQSKDHALASLKRIHERNGFGE